MAQEIEILVADLFDIPQLSVRSSRPAAVDVAVALRRGYNHESSRAVSVGKLRNERTLLLADGTPVRPKEKKDNLSLQRVELGHRTTEVLASVEARCGPTLETHEVDIGLNPRANWAFPVPLKLVVQALDCDRPGALPGERERLDFDGRRKRLLH